jgi:uncharacterized protein (TIGR03086 family)
MSIDMTGVARQVGELVAAVPDEALDHPTPCPDYRVGDLLDHLDGLSLAFTEAAEKSFDPESGPPPAGDAAHLADGWRTRIPVQLGVLAEAWLDPDAWTGMTRIAGMDMPAEGVGVVALEEVVVHGWDLARATGRTFAVADEHTEAVLGFFASFPDEARGDAYGPPVPAPDGASLLDQAVAQAGRDPGWSPG